MIYLNNLLKNDNNTYKDMFKLLSKYSSYDDYDYLINFLNENCNDINYPNFILFSFDKLNDVQKLNLILSILTSDTNIFTSWYKNLLITSKKSSDIVLSSRAQDILDLYQKRFEQIK